MSPATTQEEMHTLERFRSYLFVVAQLRLQGEQHRRIDAALMVQQTLADAARQEARLRGTPAEVATWLRKLLAQHLGNAFRSLHREDPDGMRSRPGAASGGEFVAGQATSETADPAIRLARALVELPEAQREAVLLQYWHGLTLAEIGARLDRPPAVVAGLLRRGLARLRELLDPA
jgi:RNA polymerase sigma-70 factor (ECF subfamily)